MEPSHRLSTWLRILLRAEVAGGLDQTIMIFVRLSVLDEPVGCANTYAYMRDAGISAEVMQPALSI